MDLHMELSAALSVRETGASLSLPLRFPGFTNERGRLTSNGVE